MAKPSSAAPNQSATRVRWEFGSEPLRRPGSLDESKVFVKRSADGWELVTVTDSAYYFKRPL